MSVWTVWVVAFLEYVSEPWLLFMLGQFNGAFGVSLVSGVGFYVYLVFVELSWDIMEPVTYFTGSLISLAGTCVADSLLTRTPAH